MARLVKVGRDCCCGVCVEWIVCCLSIFFKAFTKYQRLVSPIYCYYDDDDDDDDDYYYFIIIIMILCYGW